MTTQTAVTLKGIITPNSYKDPTRGFPRLSGLTKVYKSFTPTKCVITAMVTTTFEGEGLHDLVDIVTIKDCDDLILEQAFMGDESCFPNAPTGTNGISCSTLSGNDISWPVIKTGEDIIVLVSVAPTILYRTKTSVPGYNTIPKSVELQIVMNFFGVLPDKGVK